MSIIEKTNWKSILANANWKHLAIDTVWIWLVTGVGSLLVIRSLRMVLVYVSERPEALTALGMVGLFLIFVTALVIFIFQKRSNSHVFLLSLIICASYFSFIFLMGMYGLNWFNASLLLTVILFLAKFISYSFWLIYGKFSSTT